MGNFKKHSLWVLLLKKTGTVAVGRRKKKGLSYAQKEKKGRGNEGEFPDAEEKENQVWSCGMST